MSNTILPEVNFYGAVSLEPIKVLPRILQKAIKSDLKAFVITSNTTRANEIDGTLWTFAQRGFLPHALHNDQFPSRQPILIGMQDSHNLNEAKLIATIDAMTDFDSSKYTKIIDIFDGKNADQFELARKRMLYFKGMGYKVNYWQQDEKGNWSSGLN